MTAPAIKLTNVKKSFSYEPRRLRVGLENLLKPVKQKQVLKDISLTIQKKQTVGLYGPNGCGKSTLLRLMAGILQPDQGVVEINGSVASVLELGAGFNQELTGRENIYLYSTLLGMSEREIKNNVDKIIDFSDLKPDIDLVLKTYSSGMIARLAFSIVAFSKADILLLDEVLAVGDRDFVDKSRTLMKKLKKKKTIILSSHDLDNLANFCDFLIKIRDGKIDNEYSTTISMLGFLKKNSVFKSVVSSNSMRPLLIKGDLIKIQKIDFIDLRIGDVVAVGIDRLQEIVVHRLHTQDKIKNVFYTKGDDNYNLDFWSVKPENFLGKVIL